MTARRSLVEEMEGPGTADRDIFHDDVVLPGEGKPPHLRPNSCGCHSTT